MRKSTCLYSEAEGYWFEPSRLFALAVEMRNDLPLPAVFDDIRIMQHLLGEEAAAEHADGRPVSARVALIQASIERVHAVAIQHAQLASRIAAEGLGTVCREIELPIVAPTLAMMLGGVRVNKAMLEQHKAGCEIQMQIASRQLEELAGRSINPDSSQELARYLYEELNLPVLRYTKNGMPSTTVAALEPLADRHPAVQAVVKYSENRPIRNAAEALLAHAQPSGLIFAELDPLGATTGRFSCESPNLQGIPGRLLDAFEASPGHLLLEADISQCELRVLAHFSRDERLLGAYGSTSDVDVHRRTAAAVLGIPEHQVTPEQRNRIGKQLNFAIVYGMTAEGLAQRLEIPTNEAQALLDAYFTAYPGVRRWIDGVHALVQTNGLVRTLYGRRRKLPGVGSSEYGDVARALRCAVNTIIQGTAADLIKMALIRLHEVLPPEVRMLLTVHDSVLLEVPEHLVQQTRQDVLAAMQAQPPGFEVPLMVDVQVGRTWAECKRR